MSRISTSLYQFYRRNIFSLWAFEESRYQLAEYPFETAIETLNRFIKNSEKREGKAMSWDESPRSKLKFLHGDYGFEPKILFWPRPDVILS